MTRTVLFLLCFAVIPMCQAELFVGNALTKSSGLGIADFSLDVVRGDSFLLNTDLELVDVTIGSDTLLFATNFGDDLTSENVSEFQTVVPGIGMGLDIPLGESYVGFAVREPVDGQPFHTVGWAKLWRSNETLQILNNAAEYELGELSKSRGIVVGVPEPESLHVFVLFVFAHWLNSKRQRGLALPTSKTNA